MTEIRLTKEYMNKVILEHGMIPLDFETTSYNQQIHYMDKEGYKYNYAWSHFASRVNKRPIQKISQSNIYSIDNIKNYLKLNDIDCELLSDKFTGVTDCNLQFKCINCGNTFCCSWNKFKQRKTYLCSKCLKTVEGIFKKRLNKDFIYNEYKKRGLTMFDKDSYTTSDQLIHCHDEDGYKYTIKYGNLAQGKMPIKVICTNPYSIENINHFFEINNSNTRCISTEYFKEDVEMDFICGVCGKTFKRTWANIGSSIHLMCEECQIIERGKNHRIKIDEVLDGFKKMELKLLDTNYTRNSKRLLCEDKYGYRGFVCYNAQRKVVASSRTGFNYFSLNNNKENFIYNANHYCEINGIRTRVLEICKIKESQSTTILCKCECGKEYKTSINSFRSGKTRCDKCSKTISRYEQLVINYLRKNKIQYKRQKRFTDCRNILPLPFDFYLKDFNMLIEVDGQGHYQICYFNRCSKEQGLKSLESTKINDEIKTKYCKDNNINLLRIPYWEFDDNTYIEKLNQSIPNLAS